MTEEQIKQNAEEYANKHYDIPFEDNSSMNVIVSEDSYIAGAHSRDEEVEQLKDENTTLLNQCEEQRGFIAHLKAELAKAQNPWVSVKDNLPEEGQSVVSRNDYGDKGYNHCVCVFQGGKFVVVVTNLTTGKTLEIENNYVKAWMPIPKGGEG